MGVTGHKGTDVRQTGNRLIFEESLKDSDGARVTSGTTTLFIYELQDDGTLKSYDYNDNTFKTTTLTTETASMTHRTGNNGATNTGIWTYALTTVSGFTAGAIYFYVVANSGASPPQMERMFQYGSAEGDLVTTAVATGTAALKADVTHYGGTAGTFASGRPEVNTTHAAGTAWGSGAITAASIAADAITAAKVDAGVHQELIELAFTYNATADYASADAGSLVKQIADNAGGSALTEAGIADAVWDELQAGHVGAGTFGEIASEIADILVDTGTTLQGELDGIQADTEDIQTRLPAALVNSRMDCTIDGTGMETGAVDAILNRDASASTTNSTLGAIVNDWENGGRLDTIIDDILVDTGTTLQAELDGIQADTEDIQTQIGVAGAGLTAVASAASLATLTAYVDTEVAAILADTNELQTDWTNGGRLDLIVDAILEDTGTTLQAELDGIQADTEDIQTRLPAALVGGRIDATIDATGLEAGALALINTEVDTALTDIHLDHLLAATYDPASKPGAADALLNELVENDGGVSRYTANALEQAPTGGSAPTAAAIADAVWDEAQADHVGAGTFGVLASEIADILVDTAEIGAAGAGLTALASAANLATLATYVDTEVAAIKTVTDAIGATGSGLSAIPWNAAWDAEVQSEVQDAIEANHLDHFIAVADPGGVVANSSFLAKLVSKSATPAFSSYDNTTDSHEALRDRGDAAWTTATGFSTHSAADVWAVATRVLTAGTNIVLAKGTGVTGFTDLSAADVRTAVGLASANLDTQIGTLATAASLSTVAGYLDTEIAAILADTNELQTDWANGGRLDVILDARASQTSVDDLPTNAELATALGTADDATLAAIAALPTATTIADAVLTRSVSNTEGSAGEHSITMLVLMATESSRSGTTLTVKKTDGATTFATKTLTVNGSASLITGVT